MRGVTERADGGRERGEKRKEEWEKWVEKRGREKKRGDNRWK